VEDFRGSGRGRGGDMIKGKMKRVNLKVQGRKRKGWWNKVQSEKNQI
jgi:hypothetical protein